MKQKSTIVCALFALIANVSTSEAAIVSLTAGTYTENFDAITTAAPSGWDVRTGSTSSAIGSLSSYTATIGSVTTWSDGTAGFKNFASSTSLTSTSNATVQNASTNRALGIRQSAAVGDPGASFNFNFNTTDLTVSTITIDLQMLSVQPRSTTWTIQYGLGSSPTSFSTLTTYADPGSFGITSFSFNTSDFGTNLDDQSELWFRIVALFNSTGSNARDSFAIDNFSITTTSAVPETSTALLGLLSVIGLLRRRR